MYADAAQRVGCGVWVPVVVGVGSSGRLRSVVGVVVGAGRSVVRLVVVLVINFCCFGVQVISGTSSYGLGFL